MTYTRFGLMILTSTLVMFGLMYLNTYAWEHLFYSETRAYMALLMGATMTVVMLGFMLSMYRNTAVNIAIFAGAAAVFAGALWLVRSQATVDGESYMRAMIPHHSIAVMTSERAGIEDARVAKLADEIIAAQRKEIAQMRYLIADVSAGNTVPVVYEDPPATPGSVDDALDNTLISRLDLAPLTGAEADQVLGDRSGCRFNRSPETDPVLWTSADGTEGAVKFNGVLIGLSREDAAQAFTTDGMTLDLTPLGDAADWRSDAALSFELDNGLQAGYRDSAPARADLPAGHA